MTWLRLIELGTTEEKAKALASLLHALLQLDITTALYNEVICRKGLFGWEVGLGGWQTDEDTLSLDSKHP
jgi:hypothetical protein